MGSSEIVYGSWNNVGSPRLISGVCKHGKERSWTRSQRQESENQCWGTKYQTITAEGTEFNYDTVTETWGNWTDTGNTRENELDYSIEKEQERFSSPCNRSETSWGSPPDPPQHPSVSTIGGRLQHGAAPFAY